MNTGIDQILAKKAEKVAARQERAAEREKSGEVNELIIDKAPSGLYFARYSLAGRIPDDLKGFFTRKQHILDRAKQRNIPVKDV